MVDDLARAKKQARNAATKRQICLVAADVKPPSLEAITKRLGSSGRRPRGLPLGGAWHGCGAAPDRLKRQQFTR